jgi:predicted dehydrogenase
MAPSKRPLRVGVIGVGYVGALHAQVYSKLPGVKLAAVCDTNLARAQEIAKPLHCKALSDIKAIIKEVDAVSLAVPTSLHHRIGKVLLDAGIPVLIEKPITVTVAEADDLLAASSASGAMIQVGHIERFNAAVKTAQEFLTHPRFIEAHRLSPYPNRGTDVSVVLDVMIHDLDMVLSLIKAQPVKIDAIGVPVISPSVDIANARLVFANGCVANLTASRVSDERTRRIRLFQEDCYLSVDYQHQTVDLARKVGKTIARKTLKVKRRAPLDEELGAFVKAVRTRGTPLPPAPGFSGRAGVSGEEAREALVLALAIEEAMRRPRLAHAAP